MDKHLHIVTHDVPWPADFGGVYDLFHKIRSLHAEGIRIHLHCFTGRRQPQEALNRYCESVHYYPRNPKRNSFSLRLPYIVSSRTGKELLKNLRADNHPILLEGIHCTYWLYKGMLTGRKVFVRLHNTEHLYYGALFRHEADLLKKAYFWLESRLLKRYERKLAGKAIFISVSEDDARYYREKMGAPDVRFLPVFLPWDKAAEPKSRGCYCLYHGNLGISENEKAAEWLLNRVFNQLEIPFVVAGKDPSLPLQALAHSKPHTCIVMNPSEKEMQDMVSKAHVHVLPSFNETGVKLKLLNALFNGKYVITNRAGITGSGLEGLCHIAETPEEIRKLITRLFDIEFSDEQFRQRKEKLESLYSNRQNALRLISWIY